MLRRLSAMHGDRKHAVRLQWGRRTLIGIESAMVEVSRRATR